MYSCIFERVGINVRLVVVDLGVIGGSYIYEFMVLSVIGEDIIVYSKESDYVVNIEKVEVVYELNYKYFIV